jgi:murein DD-endopeptidase MepM/ murein hydrolase activator NlpD
VCVSYRGQNDHAAGMEANRPLQKAENDMRQVVMSTVTTLFVLSQLNAGAAAECGCYSHLAIAQIPPIDCAVQEDFLGRRIRALAELEQISPSAIDNLLWMLSGEIDLHRFVKEGDSLAILRAGDTSTDDSEPLATVLTVDGVAHRYYRYRKPDDGQVGYYDETGRSIANILRRKPFGPDVGFLTSGFGVRQDFGSHFFRFHIGVDWATARGMPIEAPGDGTVESVHWQSDRGWEMRLKHANGWETSYHPLSGGGASIKPGVTVRQGDIIGYVDSIDLLTMPYLHYEVKVNGRFQDPMRVQLPRAPRLEGETLEGFERERNRLDLILSMQSSRDLYH